MAVGSTYDFNNTIRDVSQIFELLIGESKNSLLNVVGGLGGSQEVTNPKYEWVEDTLSPQSGTVKTTSAIASTTIVLDGEVDIIDGSILRFSSALDVTKTVQVIVSSSVKSTDTTLTVVRPYAGSTDVEITATDKWLLIAVPQTQGSAAGNGIIHQGTVPFNYTQIFDKIAEVTNTADATSSYDFATRFARQQAIAMQKIMFDIENSLIHGRKLIASDGVGGSMAGILQLLTDASSVDAVGGAISETVINNNIEEILDDGAFSNRMILLASPNQARRITALNTTSTNPIIEKADTPAQRLGSFVSSFVGDIPVDGGNFLNVFANWRMPKDQVVLLDLDRISFKNMRSMQEKDATLPGTDAKKSRLLTEITLELKNAGQAHRLLTGLTV